MQEGHNLQTIKAHLLSSGYNPAHVDTAIAYIQDKKGTNTNHFSRKKILTMSALVAVLLVGMSFFFSSHLLKTR